MRSDRYGSVWKKLNDTAAAMAELIPAFQPPRAPHVQTTAARTSAVTELWT